MNDSSEYINKVTVADIPWNRLPTTYARATDFPDYFQVLLDGDEQKTKMAIRELVNNVEHQSTLWPASPFAMIFLVRIMEEALSDMEREVKVFIVKELADLFIEVALSFDMGRQMDHAEPLPRFEDMLKEEYLWSEEYDEDEDLARYEEEGGPFPDDQFYSFYYYADQVLKNAKSTFLQYENCDNDEVASKLRKLNSLVD